MFGPNTHLNAHVVINGSHRDKSAEFQLQRLRELLYQKFGIENYDIAFLLGGGSLGVESLMYSLKGPINVLGAVGTFTSRWQNLANQYNVNKLPVSALDFYCQLETSISLFQEFVGGSVDAVSSFPYRSIPRECPAFVISSNKQLGSMAGLSIVGVKKSLRNRLLVEADSSYLSLQRHLKSLDMNQPASTIGTHNVDDLVRRLENFNLEELRDRIDLVSGVVRSQVGEENIIGSPCGPVLTIKKRAIPIEIATKWELYEKPILGGVYQVFTYSCEKAEYFNFVRDLRLAQA